MEYEKPKFIYKEDCTIIKERINANKDFWVLLASDLHLDSKHCDREWVAKIFDEVKEKNATILILGDLFDVMGGRDDKRSNKGDIDKEFQEDSYYDKVAANVAEFLIPYVDHIGFISLGNHETAVIKHHENSMLTALMLQVFYKSQKRLHIENKYTGWVKFTLSHVTGRHMGNGRGWDMWYHHGSGGGAVMSFGVIKTKRRQAILDADIYVTGHTHQAYSLPLIREGITNKGFAYKKECIHLQLGTSKNESDWERKREFGFPTKSWYWLHFYVDKASISLCEQRAK